MVMTELRNNADFSQLPNDHPARAYKNIQNRLSIDRDEQGNEVMLKDSQKIVVPRGAQDKILKELHTHKAKPKLIKWIYTGVIRPKLTYACLIWGNKMNTKY